MYFSHNILLGVDSSGDPIYSEDYHHILLLAQHGAGKGACIVLPALLSLDQSCIVQDIGLANYELTSGYRSSIGHSIFLWRPGSYQTHKYNPLDCVQFGTPSAFKDLVQIAIYLGIQDSIAQSFFAALAMYVECSNAVRGFHGISLGQIARFALRDLREEFESNIDFIKSDANLRFVEHILLMRSDLDKYAALAAGALAYFLDPMVDNATSSSDFKMSSLKSAKTTVYVGIDAVDMLRMQPIMRMFYAHAIAELCRDESDLEDDDEHATSQSKGVTIFLDDFSATLGRCESLINMIPYCRGHKVRLCLAAPSISSIEEVYGSHHLCNIVHACNFKLIFAGDPATAKYFSEICLNQTTDAPFVSWQQIVNLDSDSQIIMCDKEQPIMSKKLFYYQTPEIKSRIMSAVVLRL